MTSAPNRVFVVALVALVLALPAHASRKSDWAVAEVANNIAGYEQFLKKYPKGKHSAYAGFLLSGLRRKAAKAAVGEPLLEAASSGDLLLVLSLLKSSTADVNYKGSYDFGHGDCTALMAASENGHLEVVRALLDAGASANTSSLSGYTALMAASENGHSEVVRALLDAGASIDHRTIHFDSTALMFASKNGHDEVVRILLAEGADEATTLEWLLEADGQPVKLKKGMTMEQVSIVLGTSVGVLSPRGHPCPVLLRSFPGLLFDFDENCELYNLCWTEAKNQTRNSAVCGWLLSRHNPINRR